MLYLVFCDAMRFPFVLFSDKKAALNIDCKTERDDLGKSKSPSEVKQGHTAPASRIIQADFNLLPLNSKPAVENYVTTGSKQTHRAASSVDKALPLLPQKTREQSPPSTSPTPTTPPCVPVMISKSQQNSKPVVQLVFDSAPSKHQPTSAPNVDKALPPLPKKSPQPSPPSTSPSSPTTPTCAPVTAFKSLQNSKPAAVQLVSDSTAPKQQPKAAPDVNKALPPLPKKSPQPSPPSTSPLSPSISQQGPQTPQMPSEQKPKPSIQIRLNVRRSLTDMLWKR